MTLSGSSSSIHHTILQGVPLSRPELYSSLYSVALTWCGWELATELPWHLSGQAMLASFSRMTEAG